MWDGTWDTAEQFIWRLNNNSLNLAFTYAISKTQICFLDLEVYVKGSILHNSTYRKPTAGNSILHARSYHPQKLKNSILYVEHLRIKRNCSEASTLETAQKDLTTRFTQR